MHSIPLQQVSSWGSQKSRGIGIHVDVSTAVDDVDDEVEVDADVVAVTFH